MSTHNDLELRKLLTKLNLDDSRGAEILKLFERERQEAAIEARIDEVTKPLKMIKDFKPDPIAPSFGSASGGFERAGWQHYFEDRLAELHGKEAAND